MSSNPEYNWYGNIQCHGGRVVHPESEDELANILGNDAEYPSPVRPCGSRHSITPCMAASAGERGWGTLVDLSRLQGPLRVDEQAATVTVGPGRRYIDVARALRTRGWQFHVNTEIGSLTMGSAACVGTKDSSFPGEFGQVGSYANSVRLVSADGRVRSIDQRDPDFAALRSSYGLLGVVSEATYRIAPIEDISIEHEEIELGEFEAASRRWLDGRTAVFLYLFPYANRVVAELRRKVGGDSGKASKSVAMRNFFWGKGVPRVARLGSHLPSHVSREMLFQSEDLVVRKYLAHLLEVERFNPVDQIIDFEHATKFTFSMWGFAADRFAAILPQYFAFCREQRRQIDFRSSMPDACYHIAQDQSSLLSYSYDGPVWTVDPVSTGIEAGWDDFLRAFNDRCDAWGGVPLFNQTPWLQRRHVERAFGVRLARFEETRRRFDPRDRLLNDYFRQLLPVATEGR
ncbi:MAG TPA: FAD-binding oxidoreductase [Burkholderiaceae bacterium]|nr:FAD-binding oxidoreductase [Burkholderiaceae bacterium]